jgi:glycerophosphoryl diester phosphodiesterase
MSQAKKPSIIAHRGSSAVAPENTIAAFTQALDDQSDGIEFDVRLSRDGVPVVFHDADLLRIAGNRAKISSLSARALADIDVGSWFNSKYPELAQSHFSDERISTLRDVLAFLEGFAGTVYVELKSSPRNMQRLGQAVGEVLLETSGNFRIIVKSFELETVPIVKSICPNIETAALFAPTIERILRKEKTLVSKAVELEFDRLSLHFSLATRKLLQQATKASLQVTVWTVDSVRWIKRSQLLGIDSVITNDPAKLLIKRELASAET